MTKTFDKAVTGFNHNIKHQGKIYHVQTEDSGVNNPHIITHLFVGGNILASKKSSYAEIRGAENLSEVVREMMEEQHKEMLRNLIRGVYDNIDSAGGVRHYQPGEFASAEESAQTKLNPGVASAKAPVKPAPAPAAVPASAPVWPPVLAPVVVPIPLLSPVEPPPGLPPEVLAARELKVPPKLNEINVETLFGEDLISEKSLDEVILSYLGGDQEA